MYPVLFSIGPFLVFGQSWGPLHFYSYGLCLAVALGLSITLFAKDAGKYIAPKIKIAPDVCFQKTFDLGMWVIICSIVGARLFYVLENHQEFENGHWLDAFKLWQGGLVFFGGLFGAALAGYFWLKSEKWPMAYFYDLVAPYILLGHAIGRIGCFLNGCCYGIEDHAHGIIFPGIGDNIPHLPTQLWELYGDLALFFSLLYARRWTLKYPWLTFSLYGFTYGILRYVIEFWRRDWDKRYLVIFNSASQAVSGIMVLLALTAMFWIWENNRKIKAPRHR